MAGAVSGQGAIQYEQALIGAILLDPDKTLPLAMQELSGEEFSAQGYREIYRACRDLYREGRPVDVVTVLGQLGEGYRESIVLAAQQVPAISHCGEYIRLVSEAHRRRIAIDASSRLCEALETSPLSQCQKLASDALRAISEPNRGILVDAKNGLLDFVERRGTPKRYIRTGFFKLDKAAKLDFGDYWVIGGRPSAGKTALTLQIMLEIAKEHPVAYYSLETSAEKIMDRLVCCYCEIPFGAIKAGSVKEEDWKKVVDSYDGFKALKFHVVEAAGWTVDQISASAVQLGAKVIFVDYLSLIKAQGRSLYERVTNTSLDLHTLAQRQKIAVIALSQLNRGASDTEPDLTSLRESGQIEQDADCVLLLDICDKDNPAASGTSDRNLIIAKNKEGQTGKIKLGFYRHFQKFRQKEE